MRAQYKLLVKIAYCGQTNNYYVADLFPYSSLLFCDVLHEHFNTIFNSVTVNVKPCVLIMH